MANNIKEKIKKDYFSIVILDNISQRPKIEKALQNIIYYLKNDNSASYFNGTQYQIITTNTNDLLFYNKISDIPQIKSIDTLYCLNNYYYIYEYNSTEDRLYFLKQATSLTLELLINRRCKYSSPSLVQDIDITKIYTIKKDNACYLEDNSNNKIYRKIDDIIASFRDISDMNWEDILDMPIIPISPIIVPEQELSNLEWTYIYDANRNGMIDISDNSVALGGRAANSYLTKSESGNLIDLTTNEKTNLVMAINEINTGGVIKAEIIKAREGLVDLDARLDRTDNRIGDLGTLNTTNKNSTVQAINELKTNNDATNQSLDTLSINHNNLSTSVGSLSSLTTIAKNNIISAINEVKTDENSLNTKIGNLSSLTTTNKTSAVNAINELKTTNETTNSNIGLLSALNTTTKTSTVVAINEVNSNIKDNYGKLGGSQTWSGSNTFEKPILNSGKQFGFNINDTANTGMVDTSNSIILNSKNVDLNGNWYNDGTGDKFILGNTAYQYRVDSSGLRKRKSTNTPISNTTISWSDWFNIWDEDSLKIEDVVVCPPAIGRCETHLKIGNQIIKTGWAGNGVPFANNVYTITFNKSFPNNCYHVFGTTDGGMGIPVSVANLTKTGFLITNNGSINGMHWFAIGD